MSLTEGQQQTVSKLKETPVKAIQFQHIYFNGFNIFENTFLYTAYAEDTTFFKGEKSVIELMKTFDIFSTFSELKPTKVNVK